MTTSKRIAAALATLAATAALSLITASAASADTSAEVTAPGGTQVKVDTDESATRELSDVMRNVGDLLGTTNDLLRRL